MEKPDNITKQDWDLLLQKYPKNINKILNKINKGYPIQYLIGNVDFFNCNILVNKHVLIPRFETEQFLEIIISKINDKYSNHKNLKIIDLGTGTGCIAINLAKIYTDSTVIAVDKSFQAIKTAKINVIRNNAKIKFIRTSFDKVKEPNVDILISNPPYIGKNDYIEPMVKKYEPNIALFAKNNGLFFYEQILKQSLKYLNKTNIIFFEIGQNQKDELTKIINIYYPNSNITFLKDYNKYYRFCIIDNV